MYTTDGTTRGWPGQDAASPITYASSQRLLGVALSRLAASGYPAPPDEAMDIIHDFYVEAWDDLMAHFDPSLAKLETYIFACFLRFARPRIARLARLRSMLMAPAEMEAIIGVIAGSDTISTDRADRMAIRRAITALPDDIRQLLISYLDDARPSERDLASRFGLTRYQLRIQLADALGRVAVRLGAANGFAEPDRAIARALWADNRSSREAASLLRLPITEIQAAKRRIFARLVQAVKGTRNMSNTHPSKETGNDVELSRALVASALSSEAAESDLAAVREHRDAIWTYLDTVDQDEALSWYESTDPLRLAAFYAALADEAFAPDSTGTEDLSPFLEARDDEERAIGEAFVQALLVNLVEGLTRFDLFAAAPTVSPEIHGILADEPSVEAAGASAVALAWFGVTPVTVAEAARAICNLAEQIGSERGVGIGDQLVLARTNREEASPSDIIIGRKAVAHELAMSLALSETTTECLFDWIGEVAARKPLFFDGYRTEPRGGDLVMIKTGSMIPDLFQRWKSDVSDAAGPSMRHVRTAAAA